MSSYVRPSGAVSKPDVVEQASKSIGSRRFDDIYFCFFSVSVSISVSISISVSVSVSVSVSRPPWLVD